MRTQDKQGKARQGGGESSQQSTQMSDDGLAGGDEAVVRVATMPSTSLQERLANGGQVLCVALQKYVHRCTELMSERRRDVAASGDDTGTADGDEDTIDDAARAQRSGFYEAHATAISESVDWSTMVRALPDFQLASYLFSFHSLSHYEELSRGPPSRFGFVSFAVVAVLFASIPLQPLQRRVGSSGSPLSGRSV